MDIGGFRMGESEWIGSDVAISPDARIEGPVVIGDGSTIGEGAQLRDSIIFPGTKVADGEIVIGAILGHAGIVQSLRRP